MDFMELIRHILKQLGKCGKILTLELINIMLIGLGLLVDLIGKEQILVSIISIKVFNNGKLDCFKKRGS